MNWIQTFDEEIADFDTVVPTWDNYANAVADFDSEVDADGDLNDHADAAHDGAVGLLFTFDDNNLMYGILNADAVNQTKGYLAFWMNLNDMNLEVSDYLWIMSAMDGGNAGTWQSILTNSAGDLKVNVRYKIDNGTTVNGPYGAAITAGWHHFLYIWERSSAVGANDGWYRIYMDGVYYIGATGIDNDTQDWDLVRIGHCIGGVATSPSGSWYMDTIKIDPVGAPFASKLAVKNGAHGLVIPTKGSGYVLLSGLSAETIVTAECWIDPNSVEMAEDDAFIFMFSWADPATMGQFSVTITYSGGGYHIKAGAREDNTVYNYTSNYSIADDWHRVRIIWAAATGVGENDGYLHIYIDGVLKESLTGLDNDAGDLVGHVGWRISHITDTGTYGIIYVDDCQWSDIVPPAASPPTIRGSRVSRLTGPVG